MKKAFIVLTTFWFLFLGCGVKAPPLAPLPDNPQNEKTQDEDKATEKGTQKKPSVDAQ